MGEVKKRRVEPKRAEHRVDLKVLEQRRQEKPQQAQPENSPPQDAYRGQNTSQRVPYSQQPVRGSSRFGNADRYESPRGEAENRRTNDSRTNDNSSRDRRPPDNSGDRTRPSSRSSSSRWNVRTTRRDGTVVDRRDVPVPSRVQNGYSRYNDDRVRSHPRPENRQVYHPNGLDSRGVPYGYWHYDPVRGYHYVPWDERHDGWEHYSNYGHNPRDNYNYYHHWYWHNRSSWEYHCRPDYWDTYVVVVPPTQYDPMPRYEGPKIVLNEVGDLLKHKEGVDRLRYDLMAYSVKDRDSDDYRFRMKDVIDSYHYLIYQVFEQVAGNESRNAWSRQYHDDPVYQQVVESLWDESLALLETYEAEFPEDSSMRGDSVDVLHWNLQQSRLVRDFGGGNSSYRNLVASIGQEVARQR